MWERYKANDMSLALKSGRAPRERVARVGPGSGGSRLLPMAMGGREGSPVGVSWALDGWGRNT